MGARTPTPPNRSLILRETRAALDVARMWAPLAKSALLPSPVEAVSLVIVVPGFGFSDTYTRPLRSFLSNKGFKTEGWGLGTNLGGRNLTHTVHDLSDRWEFERRDEYNGEVGVPYMIDRLYDRVLDRHLLTNRKISLVGWSLGGYAAREVARDMPDIVDRVITMGSPIVGGPKYTAVAAAFSRANIDMDWIEQEISRRERRPITQPITGIFSKSDGIVGWEAAVDEVSPRVRNVEVNAAHLGMGFNPDIWNIVVDALREELDLESSEDTQQPRTYSQAA